MNPMNPSRGPLYVAVVLSLLIMWGAAWLQGGIAATPYDTTDSQGRPMGFNDVFSDEHHRILLGNANGHEALKQLNGGSNEGWNAEATWHWSLVTAHLVLLALLAKAQVRTIRWFLCVQPLLFFWGWIGCWVVPIVIVDLLWGRASDREAYVDIPYIAIMSQGAWFLACGFIFWKLRPRGWFGRAQHA